MRTAVLMLFAAALGAQPVDRSVPPATPAPRAWKIPPVFETVLPNGLTVVAMQDDRVPLVTLRLVFPSGNRRDPQILPGLASAVSDLLLQGTSHETFTEIVETVDQLGGSLTATSGADQISLAGSVVPEGFAGVLSVMADVARNATMPTVELMLFLQNRVQTLARQRAQPGYIANEVFRAAIFGEHPYAHIGPSPASLSRFSQQVLQGYKNTFLVPNNAFLILVGKLPPRADLLKMISDRFGSWAVRLLPELPQPPVPPAKRQLMLVDVPGAAQADIRMGRVAAMHRDPDYLAMIVANSAVGGVPMGRMFLDIREKRGLAYDVRGDPAGFDEAGVLSFVTQVKTDSAGEALESMIGHLNRMAKEPLSAGELADAKNAAAGTMLLALQTQAGVADDLSMLKVLRLPPDFIETYAAKVDAVQAADVQRAAVKYLVPDDDAIVIVGDAAKIQPQVEKLGKFTVLKTR